MKDDFAITVENVSKSFRLPHERVDSIKGLFVNPFNKGRREFENQHALKDIDFKIKKGEFFGIVGRNGSGKSTLLKIIAGIYQPNKGKVTINGRLVPFIELGVGFNPELTGRENTYLNGALMGFSVQEIDVKYAGIVEFAELERFMDQKLKNYSSGMQVRLAFSVATILAESDILLIDEVLAVGDADFQRKCFDYFRNLKKMKKTVVFVSHDMSAIREYCDRVVMIEKSKIVSEGSPDKVAKEYTKLFLENDDKDRSATTGDIRWGEGGAHYDKVNLESRVLNPEDSEVSFTVSVDFEEETAGPIYGYSIKNAAGQYILGTNSRIKKIDSGTPKAGEKVTLQWTLPNVFADGKYYVSLAVGKQDGITTMDWWEDAATFVVHREERTPYLINPESTLRIK